VAGLIAAAVTLALLEGGKAQGVHALTGTWTWGGDVKEAGGTLVVIDEAGGTRFQLQLSRGAPSYNMGFLEGALTVEEGRAIYRSQDGACAIAFAFARETVVVKQERGSDADCGFGHAVSADGTYRRISRKKPKFDLIPE
jgi:hypothetical protein